MRNGTNPSEFCFTLFKDQGHIRYFIFILTFILFLIIILFNAIILMVVSRERALHEPMYFFISCLSANSLYGTAGFFPRLLLDLLSDNHAISRPACFIQVFVIYTYVISEYTILTLMAFDRYAAICHPLTYHYIMTTKMTLTTLFIAVIYAVFSMGLVIFFSVRLHLCGIEITRLYCSNWSVVRLSCESTVTNNIVGYFVTITTVFLPASFILFSYVRILIVCQKSSPEFKGKALQTCLPHIVTFINYSVATFCDIALSRYELGRFQIVAIIFSVEFLVIPPILNPLIYGLNLPELRQKIVRYLHLGKTALIHV